MNKIWIVTNDERCFYGSMYCNLIKKCSKDIGGIIILPNFLRISDFKKFVHEFLYLFKFLGFKGFAYSVFLWIRSYIFGSGNLEKYSKKYGIKTFKLDEINLSKKILIKNKPRLIISTLDKLVKKDLLDLCENRWLNIHCGPLPKYAGLNALFWTMYFKEKYVSVSIHIMNEKYDSGKILRQEHIINDGTPYFTQLRKLLYVASQSLSDIINSSENTLNYMSINKNIERTYFSKPPENFGKKFRKSIGRFI